MGPREAQEEKSQNSTANHKKLLLRVDSNAQWGKFISAIHSQTVKLTQVRPESSFYFQPTNMKSADSTLAREEVNGVQQEAALKEKEAEESWRGFKPLQGQEWSIQEEK